MFHLLPSLATVWLTVPSVLPCWPNLCLRTSVWSQTWMPALNRSESQFSEVDVRLCTLRSRTSIEYSAPE